MQVPCGPLLCPQHSCTGQGTGPTPRCLPGQWGGSGPAPPCSQCVMPRHPTATQSHLHWHCHRAPELPRGREDQLLLWSELPCRWPCCVPHGSHQDRDFGRRAGGTALCSIRRVGRVGDAGRGKSREIPRFLPGTLGVFISLEGQIIYSPSARPAAPSATRDVCMAQPWAGWATTAHSQKEGLE